MCPHKRESEGDLTQRSCVKEAERWEDVASARGTSSASGWERQEGASPIQGLGREPTP